MFVTVDATSANELYAQLWDQLAQDDLTRFNSLGGGSREIHHVAFSLANPRDRWVTVRQPAINPAFAIAEVIWIMSGRNDLAFLQRWNSQLRHYVGSAPILHGAYGARLRTTLGIDQLARAHEVLAACPDQRQVVLQIWDAPRDFPLGNGRPRDRDIPCNVLACLKIGASGLEWLQVIRSNDLIMGLPYNLIQWTTLHEILAGWLGVDLGSYNQISDSLHWYDHDRPNFRIVPASSAGPALPVGMPLERSNAALRELNMIAEQLLSDPAERAIELAEASHLPEPFLNWLWVLTAECLRRDNQAREADEIVDRVTCPALRESWSCWMERFR